MRQHCGAPEEHYGLVEIVDIEDRDPFRARIAAKITEVAVAAGLHPQAGARTGGEIGGHDRCGTAQKGERVLLHPRIAHRKEVRNPALALLDQRFDRVGAVCRWLPFGLRSERHLFPPLGALRAPVVEPGHV